MRSASADGDSTLRSAAPYSGGACGRSSMASAAFCLSTFARASTAAGSLLSRSGMMSKRAARNGSPER